MVRAEEEVSVFDVLAGTTYAVCVFIIFWAIAIVIRSIMEDLE